MPFTVFLLEIHRRHHALYGGLIEIHRKNGERHLTTGNVAIVQQEVSVPFIPLTITLTTNQESDEKNEIRNEDGPLLECGGRATAFAADFTQPTIHRHRRRSATARGALEKIPLHIFCRQRWRYIGLFLVISIVYLCTLTDVHFYRIIDGQIMFDTAVSLHEFGELGISPEFDGRGGRPGLSDHYGKYGIGLSIAEQLPLLLVVPTEKTFGGGSSNVALAMLNLILTALSALLVALCLDELGVRFHSGVVAAIGFAFGTIAWPYISYDFSEPLQGFCLIATFWFILKSFGSRDEPLSDSSLDVPIVLPKTPGETNTYRGYQSLSLAMAGFLLGFAVLTKANLLILIPSFAVYLWFSLRLEERRRLFSWFLLPLLLWGVGIAILNLHRFGSAFDFGYGHETAQFSNPLWAGLYSLLIGPNKGIIFYVPLALLFPWAVWKMCTCHRREVFLVLSIFVLHTALNAKWWSWEGGESWGPRMLLPVVPLMIVVTAMILDAVKWSKFPFVALLIAGVGVNLLGVLLYFPLWPVVVKLNTTRIPLDIRGRPDGEYIEQNGKRWFRPSTATNYLPPLSPIRGHAWLLRLRYFGIPFSLTALDDNSPAPALTVQYPPIEMNFALLKDRFFVSQLRSAHFWLWEVIRHQPQEEVFSYPMYAMALEHQGDRAISQNNLPRALDCFRRSAELMPNNVSPALKLSTVLIRIGARRDAMQPLLNFLTMTSTTVGDEELRQPQQRAAHFRLGQIYEICGDREDALRHYSEVLALQPNDEDRALVQKRIADLAGRISR
jgi:hypothetical protein